MSGFGIYLHWPYCSTICPYCDFNVHRARRIDPGPLLDAMARDLAAYSNALDWRSVDSVFFGGGTPSLLSGGQIAFLVQSIDQAFGLSRDAEITLEANPEDLARFGEHAAAGVNRFSIGVQALDDAALKALGRTHDANAARYAIEAAAQTGRRVSADLIYAREGQTREAWARELRQALALPIEHVSLYQLTIEKGTAFARAVARGALAPPDAESAAQLYEETQAICEDYGFPGYEISNHARSEAAQSAHNLIYWRGGDWIGLGPGAHGRVTRNGVRLATLNRRTPADYISDCRRDGFAAEATPLLPEEIVDEALLMGLRIAEGLDRARLAARPPRPERIAALVEEGVLEATPERLALTRRGKLVADRVAALLAD